MADVVGKQWWNAIIAVNCLIRIACLASQKFVFIPSFASVLVTCFPLSVSGMNGRCFASMAGFYSMSDIVIFLASLFQNWFVPNNGSS